MSKHAKLNTLVAAAYQNSDQDFGQWMWQHHVPVVAAKALELSQEYSADTDLAVAGALLHDFGDAFVHRFDPTHAAVSRSKAKPLLQKAGYTKAEATEVFEVVIAPHSCKDGVLPITVEGKVLATADAIAHLTTDFYLQFAWKHLPEGKTYDEFRQWVTQKIDRDFRVKIQFESIQDELISRYLSLRDVFATPWE